MSGATQRRVQADKAGPGIETARSQIDVLLDGPLEGPRVARRRCGAILLGLSSLVCGGCYDFDSPIDPSPSHAVEPRLLGTWRCLGDDTPDSQLANFVVTSPRERVYGITFEAPGEKPSTYEAYSSELKGGVLLNVRNLDTRFPSKPWTFARYSFLLPNVLRVQLVDDEKLKNFGQSPTALRTAIEHLEQEPDLYVEFCICVRVTDKSKQASQETTPPQSLSSPPVPMPPEMQGKPCRSGAAVVEALVTTDGRVSRVRLLRQSGADPFDTACLANAYRWVFKPGQKDGRSIETTTSILCRLECR